MATETVTSRWDDLDFAANPPIRTPATETVTFSFGDSGVLQLDLSAEHAKEIADMIQPWIDLATPVGKPARARTRTATGTSTTDRPAGYLKDFRAWAAEQGRPVEQYTRKNGKPGAYKYDPDQLALYDAHLAAAKGK